MKHDWIAGVLLVVVLIGVVAIVLKGYGGHP